MELPSVKESMALCSRSRYHGPILELWTFRPDVNSVVMSDVTRLLDAAAAGVPQAAEELLPIVYDELRKLAAARLASEKPGQTLQATALVHEAYVRLVGGNQPQDWNSRGHFFAAAAEAMRRILVENARRKAAEKHGGGLHRLDLDAAHSLAEPPAEDILAVSDALDLLAREDPVKAELVKLRCFAGLSHQQAYEVLGLSRATADRYWAYAKAWLYSRLYDAENPE
jgi:RNA polymerase sigma factor (TIGR02999 family)